MLTFSKSIITGLNRPEYAKLPNITNWMINYEKNRKIAIE